MPKPTRAGSISNLVNVSIRGLALPGQSKAPTLKGKRVSSGAKYETHVTMAREHRCRIPQIPPSIWKQLHELFKNINRTKNFLKQRTRPFSDTSLEELRRFQKWQLLCPCLICGPSLHLQNQQQSALSGQSPRRFSVGLRAIMSPWFHAKGVWARTLQDRETF